MRITTFVLIAMALGIAGSAFAQQQDALALAGNARAASAAPAKGAARSREGAGALLPRLSTGTVQREKGEDTALERAKEFHRLQQWGACYAAYLPLLDDLEDLTVLRGLAECGERSAELIADPDLKRDRLENARDYYARFLQKARGSRWRKYIAVAKQRTLLIVGAIANLQAPPPAMASASADGGVPAVVPPPTPLASSSASAEAVGTAPVSPATAPQLPSNIAARVDALAAGGNLGAAIIEILPYADDPVACERLVVLYAQAGECGSALGHYAQAHDSFMPGVHQAAADCASALHQPVVQLAALERYVLVAEGQGLYLDLGVYFDLAEGYRVLGDRERAAEYYRRYLARDQRPDSRAQRAQAEERLYLLAATPSDAVAVTLGERALHALQQGCALLQIRSTPDGGISGIVTLPSKGTLCP